MKAITIILFACLMITACDPPPPPPTPDNNATIAAGVAQGLTEQAVSIAITQTLAAIQPNAAPTYPPTAFGAPTAESIVPTNPPAATATAATLMAGQPQVIFTYVPPIGSNDFVSGRVEGVNPSQYQIAIYIQVDGGWWTKPTFASPTTPISADGTWSSAYATGGNDRYATTIVAYLIPIGYYPPAVGGDHALPFDLEENAVAKAEANR